MAKKATEKKADELKTWTCEGMTRRGCGGGARVLGAVRRVSKDVAAIKKKVESLAKVEQTKAGTAKGKAPAKGKARAAQAPVKAKTPARGKASATAKAPAAVREPAPATAQRRKAAAQPLAAPPETKIPAAVARKLAQEQAKKAKEAAQPKARGRMRIA